MECHAREISVMQGLLYSDHIDSACYMRSIILTLEFIPQLNLQQQKVDCIQLCQKTTGQWGLLLHTYHKQTE